MLATTLSIAPACSSRCVILMPGVPSWPLPSGQAMFIVFCYNVPISSTAWPQLSCLMGLTILAACVNMKSPGYVAPCS